MIRTCLEFLLSRSLDDGQPTPGLLGWFSRRNTKLGRFDTDARQLDSLLRSSAIAQRKSMAVATVTNTDSTNINNETVDETNILTLPTQRPDVAADVHSKSSTRSLRWLAGLSTAAALLLTFGLGLLGPSTPPTHAGDFSVHLSAAPGEVLNLLNQAAESTQNRLQLSPLANLKIPELPGWDYFTPDEQPTIDQESNTWQDGWQNIRDRFTSVEETS